MPNLTEIVIHAHNERLLDEGVDEDDDEDDINDLNHGDSPRFVLGEGRNLRDVSLIGASLSWGSSRLAGLRSISLQSLKQNIPTIPQVHTILSSSPSLQTLILSDFDYDGRDEALGVADPCHPIHFDQLLKLELKKIRPKSRPSSCPLSTPDAPCPLTSLVSSFPPHPTFHQGCWTYLRWCQRPSASQFNITMPDVPWAFI